MSHPKPIAWDWSRCPCHPKLMMSNRRPPEACPRCAVPFTAYAYWGADWARMALLAAEQRGADSERAAVLADLRYWLKHYSPDIFSEPKPLDELSDEERLERTRNSAAMGRTLLENAIKRYEAGEHREVA